MATAALVMLDEGSHYPSKPANFLYNNLKVTFGSSARLLIQSGEHCPSDGIGVEAPTLFDGLTVDFQSNLH